MVIFILDFSEQFLSLFIKLIQPGSRLNYINIWLQLTKKKFESIPLLPHYF